jgi:hypothetical protein
MKSGYRAIMRLAATALLAGVPVLAACEGASQVNDSAKKYDNADKDALQKQQQDMQQQADQQRQQQELLKKLQEDCQNTNFLEPRDNPNQAIDPNKLTELGWDKGAVLVLADMQLAWGNGGGGGGSGGGNGGKKQPTNCP